VHLRCAAVRARPENAIEQGKVLRAWQGEHEVAWRERRGRRRAASDPIPNHHKNAHCGRQRQRLNRFKGGRAPRFHPIARHGVLVAGPAREIAADQTGDLDVPPLPQASRLDIGSPSICFAQVHRLAAIGINLSASSSTPRM
jgi:hypothetical protein